MKFTNECVITGVKAFNSTIDGTSHNFTKISVMTDFAEGVGFGAETVQYKWGSSDNCKKLQDLDFPIKAKIEFEVVTTGSRLTQVVHNVTPLAPAPASK